MEYKIWTRKFWMALNPDAGNSTLRFATLENGETILEMVGTVDGRGVLLRWLNDERGIVSVRATPYGAPQEHIDGAAENHSATCSSVLARSCTWAAVNNIPRPSAAMPPDRKSTRLNSSHLGISYA